MKYSLFAVLAGLICFSVVFHSCTHENRQVFGETKISKHNENESHNMGQNCMNCHVKGGEGSGIFQAAGTAYNSTATQTYPNATVNLYTGPNGTGTLVKTIEVDGKGNFYTTESINFSGGLYPSVTGSTTSYMGSSTISGACNSCHGVSTGKITVN